MPASLVLSLLWRSSLALRAEALQGQVTGLHTEPVPSRQPGGKARNILRRELPHLSTPPADEVSMRVGRFAQRKAINPASNREQVEHAGLLKRLQRAVYRDQVQAREPCARLPVDIHGRLVAAPVRDDFEDHRPLGSDPKPLRSKLAGETIVARHSQFPVVASICVNVIARPPARQSLLWASPGETEGEAPSGEEGALPYGRTTVGVNAGMRVPCEARRGMGQALALRTSRAGLFRASFGTPWARIPKRLRIGRRLDRQRVGGKRILDLQPHGF